MVLGTHRLRPLLLCVALLTWARPTVAQSVAPSRVDADSTLHARMTQALAETRLTGVVWALITPDTVRVGAAGVRDAALGAALTPLHRVHVGSVAKTLLATGVLALVTEGRVSLDDPVHVVLPEITVQNPWAAQSPLRVRHLLDHTGGLDDARLRQVFTARGDPDAPLVNGLGVEPVVRVRHPPGDRFSYSNTSYLLLGLLMERLTGERYEAWLDRTLLAPLGMQHSTFLFTSHGGVRADTSMAMGHFDIDRPQDAYAIPVRPASQFTTTAADMARFARFLMSDGVVAGRSLVDSTLLRAMAVPSTTEAARAGLAAGYGLGLMRRERWGRTGHCHLGNIGTFRAILCLYPTAQRAFFASYNIDPENAPWDRVDSLLAMALEVPPTAAVPSAAPSIPVHDWDGWYLVRPNRFAQFAYLDAIGGVTRIRWTGAQLALVPLPGTARLLDPVGGALFRLSGRSEATHVLSHTADGTPLVTDGLRTYERVSRVGVIVRWMGALVGVFALIALLLWGTVRSVRAWRRGGLAHEPLRWPTRAVWCLGVTPLLYLREPALAIGDPTVANVLMAVVTGALPVAMLIGLWHRVQTGLTGRRAVVDVLLLLGVLQWCATLSAWGLLPLTLWR